MKHQQHSICSCFHPLLEGHDLTLTCETKGDPIPRVVWYKDGKEIRKWRAKLASSGKSFMGITSFHIKHEFISCD